MNRMHPFRQVSLFLFLSVILLSACKKEQSIVSGPDIARTVYWTVNEGTDGGAIMKGTTDASGKSKVEVLYNTPDGVRIPWGIAVDTIRNYVYWINGYNSLTNDMDVVRAPLSGNGPLEVIFSKDYKTNFFIDLVLDTESNLLYLTNSVSEDRPLNPAEGPRVNKAEIYKISLNQPQSSAPLYTINTEASISDVKLDKANGKIYWAMGIIKDTGINNGSAKIMQGSINGQQSPIVLFDQTDGLLYCWNIAVDGKNQKIYINSFDGEPTPSGMQKESGMILQGNLDGTGSLSKLFQENSLPFGNISQPVLILDLEMDVEKNCLYWMTSKNDGEIKRMKLSDRLIETSYTGLKNGLYFDVLGR
ncbi:hypothetical protein [Desertivirga brevis]|uniref:hypothetical protein n=1 Tax=Desertivirga brevis TaxID=2810310 RepID=UPI001A9781CF|nr:hypothetical protein [Pedobacter sp. SYSU D00873]